MNDSLKHGVSLPPEQQAIRDKCFHPSGTFVEFPIEEVEQSIPQRFEKIVDEFPDQIAIKTSSDVVTYAELNAMANQIAFSLLERGDVNPGLIALYFETSVPLIAAMLGVLKAGKCFVVLDTALPGTLASIMLEDSQATLLLAESKNQALAQNISAKQCPLDVLDSRISGRFSKNASLKISPSAMAFLLYTSGSTGKPKGVIWSHRHLLHHEFLHAITSRMSHHDRVTLLTSGTANAVTNALLPLVVGATLLPFAVQRHGVTQLAQWLQDERISISAMSSTLFRCLCETLSGQEKFPDLRVIRSRSDSLTATDIDLFKKHFPQHCVLLNGLSTTETGILRSYAITHSTEVVGTEIPVGFSLDGKDILLLDTLGNEVGFNEVGEIAVKSEYIASGYWRNADLTSHKFSTDSAEQKHIYFTGDLGILRPDGCLIHKGRKDFRVKIRGYGVDVAEVEKVLRSHAAVKDAVGVARNDESGETRLIAYFTVATQRAPTISELREYLSKTLPDYMIPSVFVRLDAMPLTPSGKIDRRALPHPEKTRPELRESYVAPQDELETRLARIWREVLCLDRVGIHDNFFDLGGHSLAASRVISRVIQTFQLELPVKALFDAPTVAEMAAVITQNLAKPTDDTKLARMLCEVEAMTEEEAQKQLAGESGRSSSGDRHE